MSTLSDFIKSQPQRSLADWAEDFGISRPHLHSLMNGDRNPSVVVAQRIASATGGAVPINHWPNISQLIEAARGAA
jgi:transcriptional regulator with XRE-family HTH domain